MDSVKLYCPLCEDVYDVPPIPSVNNLYNQNTIPQLDGAYFGPSFPHLLLLGRTQGLKDDRNNDSYTPRIFGFKVRDQRGRKSLLESMVSETNITSTTENNINNNHEHTTTLSTKLTSSSSSNNTTTTTLSSSSSSSKQTLASMGIPYPGYNGVILDPLILKIRNGVPLTYPWQDGKRPEMDDFNDDDDDDAQTASALKRRKRQNGAGE